MTRDLLNMDHQTNFIDLSLNPKSKTSKSGVSYSTTFTETNPCLNPGETGMNGRRGNTEDLDLTLTKVYP